MPNKTEAWVRKVWRQWVKPLVVILVVTCSFRSAIADWNDVPTGSMKPTILEGDRIFVSKIAYDLKVPFTTWRVAEWAEPQRGDVVVLYGPDDGVRLVKRVVGLPGDRIEMRNGRLFVNGKPAAYKPLDAATANQIEAAERPGHRFAAETIEEQTHPVMLTPGIRTIRSFGPVTVPEDHFFVMGDNRDASRDSRRFGCVERKLIVGKALGVVLSLDPHRHYLPRWHRFFRGLP